jgi:DNA-binding NtrC family response regulator
MRALYLVLERLARTDLSVLLEGDTGTGTELAARALHDASPRNGRPFVALDCTAIPATLAESVLFGHEKGAFTGATARRAGVFESVAGGTVFLDEIGELPLDLQPKLLRVLERREVVPVGATHPVTVDLRVIAASWRDLRAMVNAERFRQDVYHRIAQARVRLPALSERRDDIRPLVMHILATLPFATPAARAISDEALEMLALRPYPGNVRELKYSVERLAMLADGPVITASDLAFDRRLEAERLRTDLTEAPPAASSRPASPDASPIEPYKDAKRTLIEDFEREYLERLLARTGMNISQAARLAGIERPSLRELLKRHGLHGKD